MKGIFSSGLALALAWGSQAQGTWTQKQSFSGPGRYGAACFSINGKGYMVGGFSNTGVLDDTWEYAANAWTQKANFPGGPRGGMLSFSDGVKGYCGVGGDGGAITYTTFYEYDPPANTWTQEASFPGFTRYAICNMVNNGKGYFSNGLDSTLSNVLSETYEYDPAANAWTAKAPFPSTPRFATGHFTIGSKGYACCGFTGMAATNELWEYDMTGNAWTQKANFPGIARMGGCGFSINLNGYYGLGFDPLAGSELADLYRYNQASNTWGAMASLPDTGNIFRGSFVLNGKGYVVAGETIMGALTDMLWEFDPPASSSTDDTNEKNKQVVIFPNPLSTQTTLIIRGAGSGEMKVHVYDAGGRLVRELAMRADSVTIQREELPTGIYFIEITREGKMIAASKLAVQ